MAPALPLIRPLIMCGGSGTRLWPISRETLPKQFARLVGARSTFQETLLRVADPSLFGKPVIIANWMHQPIIQRQLDEIGIDADVVLEPVARDSAPAIIAGSLTIAEHSPDALVLVLAADHLVRDPQGFRDTVAIGRLAATEGAIVTFGIVPTEPATAYGYIEPGAALHDNVHRVARFIEKPDAATAVRLVKGGYYWNSGNFMFRPDVVFGEYARHDPESFATIRAAIASARRMGAAMTLAKAAFERARKISFDFAVMEKTPGAAVVAGDFGWSDIGGWDALWSITDKDADGNVTQGDVMLTGTTGSYARSDGPLLTLVGMENAVVVATGDAVLVADRGRAGEIKNAVEALKKADREETRVFPRDDLNWGSRERICRRDRFGVAILRIDTGGTLMLQASHVARTWLVAAGSAQASMASGLLSAGDAVSLPADTEGRIANAGPGPVELIELELGR